MSRRIREVRHDTRPLRKVLRSQVATLSGAEARGDHYDDVLDCGHLEPVIVVNRESKRRRCSTCPPVLPGSEAT